VSNKGPRGWRTGTGPGPSNGDLGDKGKGRGFDEPGRWTEAWQGPRKRRMQEARDRTKVAVEITPRTGKGEWRRMQGGAGGGAGTGS